MASRGAWWAEDDDVQHDMLQELSSLGVCGGIADRHGVDKASIMSGDKDASPDGEQANKPEDEGPTDVRHISSIGCSVAIYGW